MTKERGSEEAGIMISVNLIHHKRVKFLWRMCDCRCIHFRTGATVRVGETE